jgi:hypothetical protein
MICNRNNLSKLVRLINDCNRSDLCSRKTFVDDVVVVWVEASDFLKQIFCRLKQVSKTRIFGTQLDWWMIFQFLYQLYFVQFHRNITVFSFWLSALDIESKRGIRRKKKAQMYRISCLLKPHKLIMRSKLSFYVDSFFSSSYKNRRQKRLSSEKFWSRVCAEVLTKENNLGK